MKEPQIVTEIYRLGCDLGYTLEQIGADLIECESTEGISALVLGYMETWMVKHNRSWYSDNASDYPVPMTEEEFEEWIRFRPTPEAIAKDELDQPAQTPAHECHNCRHRRQQWDARGQVHLCAISEKSGWGGLVGDGRDLSPPCDTWESLCDEEEQPARTIEDIAQQIADSPEQESVELPYALKVEMLVNRIDELGNQVAQFGHRLGHLEQLAKQTDKGEASYEASVHIDQEEHETLHNNLDASLTDLSNRLKELEAQHQYGDTDL